VPAYDRSSHSGPEGPVPRRVNLAMSGGTLALSAAVFLLRALYVWQPWAETPAGGQQGGADTTPVPQQQIPPAPP